MGVKKLAVLWGLSLFVGITYQNCAKMEAELGGSLGSLGPSESYQAVQKIFDAKCVSCHGNANSGNLFVSLANFDETIASAIVVAGNADSSPLYVQVESGLMPPPPSPPLSNAELAVIKNWIDSGALDDSSVDGQTQNNPPTVNAGMDRTVTLPQPNVVLNATASDSDGAVVQVNWTQTSGAPLTLSGANSLTLVLSNLQPGTYGFQVMVRDDDGAQAMDMVTLTILGGGTQPVVAATFSSINSMILQPKCATCHNANQQSGGYSVASYAAVLSGVVANNAAASVLYSQVNSNSMPRNANPLSLAEKNAIREWINQGALNN